MTRQPSPSRSPSSWVGFKELARQQYERGAYEEALTSYTSALNPEYNCPPSEQQIILSNLVACRLKIGGPAQARAAVENAKTCIEKNPQWAKGHVRLASAYIALGGHSNDACNELQRALAIDPGNTTAREMLVRELRRDHAHASRANSSTSNNANNHSEETSAATNPESTRPDFDDAPTQNYSVDESFTWSEWCQFQFARVTTWYHNQSDDVKTGLKIGLLLLVLYVAFGGRFGLQGTNRRQTGNYGSDNVYEQYRRYGTTESQSKTSYPYHQDSSNSRGRGRDSNTNNHRRTYSDHGNDDYYYSSTHYGGGYGGGGYRGGGLMDGSMQSMLILGGIIFAAQRMGLNPFQTMMFMNMMGGGRMRPRRGFGMGMGGFGGFGRGMGGMGRMGRMRHHGRRF